jgi:hypothetical protein
VPSGVRMSTSFSIKLPPQCAVTLQPLDVEAMSEDRPVIVSCAPLTSYHPFAPQLVERTAPERKEVSRPADRLADTDIGVEPLTNINNKAFLLEITVPTPPLNLANIEKAAQLIDPPSSIVLSTRTRRSTTRLDSACS